MTADSHFRTQFRSVLFHHPNTQQHSSLQRKPHKSAITHYHKRRKGQGRERERGRERVKIDIFACYVYVGENLQRQSKPLHDAAPNVRLTGFSNADVFDQRCCKRKLFRNSFCLIPWEKTWKKHTNVSTQEQVKTARYDNKATLLVKQRTASFITTSVIYLH